jgi:hypothetical protein
MSGTSGDAQPGARGSGVHDLVRWECRCQQPPVLLGTYDARGRIHIKARDRYWHIDGRVQTVCPRCGSEHALDLRAETARRQDGKTASGESAVGSR